ncbi:BPTI/Kunitz-type proteinase inhibitor domain-containing protein [Aureispira sp. CCB-QB1]|uniref:BPTI/Kunitz-type proteinase inhibitor domain-containing protein n=1 Tax=Aureispira sp. CCB-QB1 TaxID=1313421 RepID=UPI0009DCDC8F|nr:BPTI/Kunitz-type proteinase inhibitor domain-containing protein [Aureispira sp. CCB-QB1]
MITKYFRVILFVMTFFFFASCEKDSSCTEHINECRLKCEMIPDMGWCGTGAEYKYYFNPITQQCEPYIYIGYDAVFETLQECQACGCGNAEN